ncbi:hypothetical protein C8R43DRAFT_993049 [Mycena crocata]|nr:hypothetical protein C8R43DRAFT_993049 [Mycena crocata]
MHRLNEQDTAAWLIKRDARLPPGLQFFENVYQIQNRPGISFADSDGETDLSGVENLDKTELQHEADGDANKSASSGSDDDADDDEDDDVEADQDAEDDADDVEGDGTDGNLDADNQFEIAVDANSSSFDFSSSDISMRTADAFTGSAPDALAADGTKIQTHHLVALADNIAAMAAAVPRSPVLRDSPGTGLNGIAPSDLHALFVSPPGISANMANWRLPSLSPNPSADRALREFTNDVGTLKTPSPLWSEVRREVRVTDGVDGYLACLDGSRAGDEVFCSPRARTTLFSGPSLLGPAFQKVLSHLQAQTGEPTPLSFYLVQPVAPLDAAFEPEPPTAAAKVQATPERKGDGRIPLSPFNFQHKDQKGKGRAH